MNRSKVEFEDILEILKKDVDTGIFKLCYQLDCGEGIIYKRIVSTGRFNGLTDLKKAIRNGEI